MKITAKQLRKKYLDFFKEKGHTIISGASLIPENDPTVLFTTAGMHPLVPYLMGEKHPGGKRLVDVQKCLRTDDIDEVGDATHHTFFEMLGNWSLGDYFKSEAIEWSLEFLTSKNWLSLDFKKLAVSVFAGDSDAPFDKEAFDVWVSLGVSEKRIARLPKKNNWWGPAGQTGPCGPDTEMFYWTGQDPPSHKATEGQSPAPEVFDAENVFWVEIWNDVFMQYNKKADGNFELLKQQNVDTGMGMERTLAVLNSLDDNYKTELFWPIIEKIEAISDKKYPPSHKATEGQSGSGEIIRAMRIIADHLRSAVFVLAEGLEPSNTERGYVLRKLIRRAVRYGKQLGIHGQFCAEVAEVVVDVYQDAYPEVFEKQEFIKEQLQKEEGKFSKTLEEGLKKFEEYVLREDVRKKPKGMMGVKGVAWDQGMLYGREAFLMYQSFGFPREIMKDLCKEKGIWFDEDGFEEEMKKHQELSRTASAGVFKGGLQDHSEISTKYHTATHLLQAALRQILGNHVFQKGSNITGERMRFDFPHPKEITQEELKKVEDLVNQKIQESLPVHFEEMELEKAKQIGALGVFESKYGEKVKVYFVGPSTRFTRSGQAPSTSSGQAPSTSSGQAPSTSSPQQNSGQAGQDKSGDYFSIEICGGPHVENTFDIGGFRIQKCESIGQGVKRIRAVIS